MVSIHKGEDSNDLKNCVRMGQPSLYSCPLQWVCHRDLFWALSYSPFIPMKLSLPCMVIKFPDENMLYCIDDSVQLATEKLQLSFHALRHSLGDRKRKFYANKAKFMVFSNQTKT